MSRCIFALTVCCACWCSTSTLADEPKTADEVISRYIEAIGGLDELDAVQTMRVTGKMTMMGGSMNATMSQEYKRPSKIRADFSLQGMQGTQVYNAGSGWFVMPFGGSPDPEKMGPEMLEHMAEQAEMYTPLVNYEKKGHTVELIGKEDLEGTEVYRIKVTRKNSNVDHYFLDSEYFIPIQVQSKRAYQGNEFEVTMTFGDYKEVDGLMMAHSMGQSGGMGGGASVTIEKIELNVDIPDQRFEMPEVKEPDAAADTAGGDAKPAADTADGKATPVAGDGQ